MASAPERKEADISLAIASMVHGAHDARVLADRDSGIMCCLTAAVSFAVDTGGRGGEERSISRVQEILDELKDSYRMAVVEGYCNGRSKGGFSRGR